jgi:hypothetical protein
LLVTVNIVDRTVDSVCVLVIVRMLVDVVKTVVLALGSTTVDTIVDVNTFVIVDVRVTVVNVDIFVAVFVTILSLKTLISAL